MIVKVRVIYCFNSGCTAVYIADLQSLYIVGSLDESLNVRGFRYHPVDLEATVVRCHKNICGR